jgi:glycosyltransferase involved in cell wall biosynthesis
MSAFPKVLEKVPNARLIVAGSNHHTKPGYWESIRDAQPACLPIEFRGYVPEEAIPELFQTTSVLVLPYDSATGSSGPAHQACEFGVPIVCSDIDDFKEMVAGEGMAVRFYKKGDPDDLARQFVAILKSPELLSQMAEHNFGVGIEMKMSSVVKNYLRWFELHKRKKAVRRSAFIFMRWRPWLRSLKTAKGLQDSSLQAAHSTQRADGTDGKGSIDSERRIAHPESEPDLLLLSYAKSTKQRQNGEVGPQNSISDANL